MVHATVLLVLRIITTVSSVMLLVSPWRDFRHIVTNKSTGKLTLLPLIMLFANCYL